MPQRYGIGASQSSHMQEQRFNPLTGQGTVGAPPEAPPKGVFISPNQVRGNLSGASCLPREDARTLDIGRNLLPVPGAPHAPERAMPLAKKHHIIGGACMPRPMTPATAAAEARHTHAHHEGVTLRASVDHLAGLACTVRDVHAQATADEAGPTVERGMVTKILKDRMEATEGKNRMQGSAFYCPGQGYSQASEAATRRGYVVGDGGRIM